MISVIKFEDWLQLEVFTDHCIVFNATNETQLRLQAHMEPKDPIPDDVKETIKIYQKLDTASRNWRDKIVPGTSEIALEVIRHRDDCKVYYKMIEGKIQKAFPGFTLSEAKSKLTEQWQLATPSAPAMTARNEIARVIGRLLEEAKRREGQAKDQLKAMETFRDDLIDCKRD